MLPVDTSQSSSLTVLEQGTFHIQYVTPGSDVSGDYVKDVFGLGNIKIQNLIMAVATSAAQVDTGILGIGFDTDESRVAQGGKPYRNIVDQMVDEGLINSRAYSLWLDDIGKRFRNPWIIAMSATFNNLS